MQTALLRILSEIEENKSSLFTFVYNRVVWNSIIHVTICQMR